MTRPDLETFEFVWPLELIRPGAGPALLYLDLNHWINLAKSRLRRSASDGQYSSLLEACRRAVEEKRVRIVLSAPLVQEIYKIQDPRQRNDVADVIGELTEFEYLAGLVDVRKLELQAVLDAQTGTHGIGHSPIGLVGRSLLHAFGMNGGLSLSGKDGTRLDKSLFSPALRERVSALERQAERLLIAGPDDDDLPELRVNGYSPEVSVDSMAANARIEQHFADRLLNNAWRRGRLRDVLTAREVNLELHDMLVAELSARNLTLSDVAGNLVDARKLVLTMPSSCVAVELKTHYHRDAMKRWSVNDLYDIHAMSLAVPYCDIVFTDAAVRDGILRSKLHDRMETLLPRRPGELVEVLDGL